MYDVTQLSATIIPKSDQLNAEQLLAGPMTISVKDVRTSASDEQPVVIHYHGENGRPYKPCKTMRKLLILAWGEDGRRWVGKSMTLFNQADVRFGGAEVGGIRISHLSHIPGPIKASLTSTRGKKALHTVQKLELAENNWLNDIKSAETMQDLQAAYKAAYKASRSDEEREAVTEAKNRKKVALESAQKHEETATDSAEDMSSAQQQGPQ